jgi:phytoene synthase
MTRNDMTMDHATAIADVKARVAKSRTTFHAGMALLPKVRREAMYAFYAFCREVDDIADESPNVEVSLRGLQQWRERINALFSGHSSEVITAALLPAITRFDLIEADFQSIIDGMAMDAGNPIYAPDTATLDLYCDRVASAVGRVSVRIFGDASPQAMQVAYHLGRALQLTNILRDLGEDASRGRLYLPAELLAKYSICVASLTDVLKNPALAALCRELATTAEAHFTAADAAMKQCKPAAMRPAKIMRSYYGAILKHMQASDWRQPEMRTTLRKWQKLWLVGKTLLLG